MPEGPEVKVITTELNQHLENSILKEFVVLGGRFIKTPIENIDTFQSNLPLKINSVNCKGKFIWFDLENNWSIWNTLGMSGGWKQIKEKHSHIKITTDNLDLWFTDTRRFGTIKISNNPSELKKKLESIGPDMLSDSEFSETDFIKIMRKYNKKELPKILMEQKIVSGIGNYIKAEALYESKISPLRKIEDISDSELKTLFKSIRSIITKSYKCNGATIKNYSDLANNLGEYCFNFKVYNQNKDVNGYNVLKTKTNDGRTTHWVSEIQK